MAVQLYIDDGSSLVKAIAGNSRHKIFYQHTKVFHDTNLLASVNKKTNFFWKYFWTELQTSEVIFISKTHDVAGCAKTKSRIEFEYQQSALALLQRIMQNRNSETHFCVHWSFRYQTKTTAYLSPNLWTKLFLGV